MVNRWLIALVLSLVAGLACAQDLAPIPVLTGHVIDQTGTLTTAQQQTLESTLGEFESTSGTQMVVLLVPSTSPEDIASYANRVANSWKIGRRDIGDGLLLIVAKNDRKLRIEVAKTLEGAVPDLAAKQVMDEFMTPRFKAGDFAGGIEAGVTRLMDLVKGEGLPGVQRSDDFQWSNLLAFLFFGVIILGSVARRMFGSKGGSLLTGAVVGFIVWSATASIFLAIVAALVGGAFALLSSRGRNGPTGGHGGGWGGGFGGSSPGDWNNPRYGGFHSGGGGDFGGGGASGDW